ncbi:hypothetical protein RCL1_000454 [Eukaryota sp. TZLM3-RCL]
MTSTLQNIADRTSLKWIWVGGKGGVGKTSMACALAVYLSKHRDHDILLVSTDPAHNLSDALSFAVGSEPTLVQGTSNLYAMEIDPSKTEGPNEGQSPLPSAFMSSIQDAMGTMPGMDEAAALFELLRHLEESRFPLVIFDTAPTGHTLKLLQLPQKLQQLTSGGGLLSMLMGSLGSLFGDSLGEKTSKANMAFSSILPILANPDLVTFIPVGIPEFLSLWETERLIQSLFDLNIDVSAVILNQLIPGGNTTGLFDNPALPKEESECPFCKSRKELQSKYIIQYKDLYSDFDLVGMPLFSTEVRGINLLYDLGKMLMGMCPN